MPELFHFTTKNALHHIISDREILPRAVCVGSASGSCIAVCLTSDSNPNGHGLPDGREVNLDEGDPRQGVYLRDGKYFSLDHTLVRLKINIPVTNEKLVYVPPLFDKCPEMLFKLDIGGYLPCTLLESASKDQLMTIVESFRSGCLERKSQYWWYYFGEIPFTWVTEIGFRVGHLQYISEKRDVFLNQWKREIQDMRE